MGSTESRLRASLGPNAATRGALGLAAAVLGSGCATSELPVQHVAVYRNGVAYFERAGRVSKDEVRFAMRPTDVGDFLATLAVMDGTGDSVRAAAFPSRVGGSDNAKDGDRETVVLTLDGRPHDLRVGYVAQSPVWKPSYRLVMHANGSADLQVWGIVENFSGEDWRNVRLSLVAGAPIAFQADLGTPITPGRPMVTDEGENNSVVPHGETTLAQRGISGSLPEAPPGLKRGLERSIQSSGLMVGSPASGGSVAASPTSRPAPPPRPAPLSYNMSATAPAVSGGGYGAQVLAGGSTRYDLPLPVTIRDGGASMVLALDRSVTGEVLMLFAPDPSLPDSSSHPFRAACFKNTTGGTIERGPIAMFDEGAFLGQGLLDPLPAGATATMPFALERSVEVRREGGRDDGAVRVASIEHGELYVEQDRTTTYRVTNGADQPAKVLVRHVRLADSRLVTPPEGTQEELSRGTALVPAQVAPHSSEVLALGEAGASRRTADWLTDVADQAIRRYMADPKADADAVQKLSAAWAVRRELVKRSDERYSLQQESYTLGQQTPQASDAKAKIAANTKRVAELDAKIGELTSQFQKALLGIRVVSP
jgi:hypothetical protein